VRLLRALVWHLVHLKSLTLKGFKSFASPTTLRFEPGITCVVGPNGSGKSNVVDALSWVMGEQGAKTLRGGKMEDVIFAGTSSRAPLGRAEVTVTIDNSDSALPIEYSEVSITRRMFRDGASEYEINGSSCRLMDIQELLSDSGIGREMHVIVGQGKLSEILESRPEDRRAFIEEAAGVLKHRKRKEKAVRKLEAMSANLARLSDLTTELRRQLKPLGRQAEVARRAQTIQADLRDARLRLAADDLVARRNEFAGVGDAEAALRREHDEASARLDAASAELSGHEQAVASLTERAESAQQTWFRLSALAERVSATVRIAKERAQHLDIEPPPTAGVDPDMLDAEADEVAATETRLVADLNDERARLDVARTEMAAAEQVAAEAERAHMAAVRAEADRREGFARLAGQVDTMRTRVESIDEAVARLTDAIDEAGSRSQHAQAEFETVQARVGELDEGEVGLDEHHDRSVAALRVADERVGELQTAERGAERQVASLRARIEALSVGLDRKDGVTWITQNLSNAGLFGSLANLVKVRPGCDRRGRREGGSLRGGRAQGVRWRPGRHRAQRLAGTGGSASRRAARRRAMGGRPGGGARTAAGRGRRDVVRGRGGGRSGGRARPGDLASAAAGGHPRRRSGGRRMGQRRLRPPAEHARDHVRDRERSSRTRRRRDASA
jgi:chromosome segregation protein